MTTGHCILQIRTCSPLEELVKGAGLPCWSCYPVTQLKDGWTAAGLQLAKYWTNSSAKPQVLNQINFRVYYGRTHPPAGWDWNPPSLSPPVLGCRSLHNSLQWGKVGSLSTLGTVGRTLLEPSSCSLTPGNENYFKHLFTNRKSDETVYLTSVSLVMYLWSSEYENPTPTGDSRYNTFAICKKTISCEDNTHVKKTVVTVFCTVTQTLAALYSYYTIPYHSVIFRLITRLVELTNSCFWWTAIMLQSTEFIFSIF